MSAEMSATSSPTLQHQASTATVKGADGEDILMPDVEAMRQAKELRDLAPDSDLVQLIMATGELIVDCFKMVIASLLSVFTPQLCPLLDPATAYPVCLSTNGLITDPIQLESLISKFNSTGHECSIDENFTNLTDFNKAVLGWNFITLGTVLIQYIMAWRRERFMIDKLEISNLDTRIHLRDIIHQYPHIEDRLQWYNRRVFELSVIGILFQVVNILMSAVLIFRDYYNGYKSVTSFFTNVLITATVLKNAAVNTYIGMKHRLAYSAVSFDPISYNNVSPLFRIQGK